jgi:hypothetical protein
MSSAPAFSNRDRWVAAALPAMLTLLVGWLFFLRPAVREAALMRQRVENLGALAARQALVPQAQAEQAGLGQALEAKRAASGEEESVFDRNHAMQLISRLCAAHGLRLDHTGPEPGAQLPAAFKEALPAFDGSGTTPQVWRIEVRGAYPGILKLLGSLREVEPLIVPLGISMRAGKTERTPASWVLTFWL